MSIEAISKGTMLMQTDEPADSIVFIISGLAQALDGEQPVALLSEGDFAGESLFSEEATRNADIQAIKETAAARFTIHDFNKFLL